MAYFRIKNLVLMYFTYKIHDSLDVCLVGDVATDVRSDPAVSADVVAYLLALSFWMLAMMILVPWRVNSPMVLSSMPLAIVMPLDAHDDRHLPLQSTTEMNSRYKHERMEETSTRKGSYHLSEEE